MPPSYSDQIAIEKSPSYFRTDSVPKRIFDMNPKMKLILIVCSPIKRTVSIYTHMLAHKSRLKFDPRKHHNHSEHLASEIFDKNGRVIIDNEERNLEAKKGNLIYDSLYVVHLKKWLKYFPLDQFLILSGEEFIKNPYNEVMKVEKFLNLESFFNTTSNSSISTNSTSFFNSTFNPAFSTSMASKIYAFICGSSAMI